MNTSVLHTDGAYRRPIRIMSSTVAVGALVAGTMAATTTSADAATNRTWNRLANCESGGNWHINTGNGYYGGLQFSASTWRAYGGGKYASFAHRASRWQQIKIAQKVLRGQGWGAWPSCSSRLGLSRADAKAKWEGRRAHQHKKLKAIRKSDSGQSRRMLFRTHRTHKRTVLFKKPQHRSAALR